MNTISLSSIFSLKYLLKIDKIFLYNRFLHPLVYGDYPPSMRARVKDRLPKFTKEEISLTLKSYDFIGINYYTANYVKEHSKSSEEIPCPLTDFHATITRMHIKLIKIQCILKLM